MILAFGCCLYLATGMLLGIPVYMALARFAAEGGLVKRLIVASVVSLLIWAVMFYGILSWLQPLLVEGDPGNWITNTGVPSLVGGRGDAPGLRLDHRPALPAGRVPSLPSAHRTGRLNAARATTPGPATPSDRAVLISSIVHLEQSEETTLEKELPRHEDLVDERLVFWHFMAALIFMGASMLGGLLMALQLLRLNPFSGIELLSPGRWRMIHTNAIAYGFIANAFLGVLQWVVPRLTLHPVYNPKIPA